MIIRLAAINDIFEIEKFYNAVIDYANDNINYCGWKKGIYPARKDIEQDISEGTIYIAFVNGEISGAIVLNHEPTQSPDNGSWMIDAKDEEVFNVRRFAVHPDFWGQKVGKLLLEFSYNLAKKRGIKALRLDVFKDNMPAIKSYEKCGYSYIDTVDLGLGCYGLDLFRLYEKLVEQ
ncbi:MAG: GNAT family N-acetyltransferase [Defluviitaleaceae bacterium]|nr:GNAT family N-acetyltransferase [Defluviitaleaceae bacterium]